MPSAPEPIIRRSDQFDIRLNVDSTRLRAVLVTLDDLWKTGMLRYLHCSGVEIGDVPGRTSYGVEHVHVAAIFNNFTTRISVIKKFVDKKYGWYVEPRDKKKSLHGWISYHKKLRSKVDPTSLLLFERGDLPRVREPKPVGTASAKMVERAEQWARRKTLMVNGMWEELDLEFPGFIWTSSGQNMKREILKQTNTGLGVLEVLDNYIIWGPSGSGKSSSVAMLYPECYKKQKGSQYWDGYDKKNAGHKVVWIDEMSVETLKTFSGKVDGGFEFLKELADRYPVTVDEKYTKGYKIRPTKIIITMNEHPTSLLPDRAREINKQALYRKFKVLHVTDWLALNGLECTASGCRLVDAVDLDDLLTFEFDPPNNNVDTAEIRGEYDFNMSCRARQDESIQVSAAENARKKGTRERGYGIDQGTQTETKNAISFLLCDEGGIDGLDQ
jgi:hypothetical protein